MTTIKAPEIIVEQDNTPEEQNALLHAAHKVLQVWIGAFAMAQDEIESLVGRLIERGEIAEQDGRKLVSEVMDKRKHESKKTEEKVTSQVNTLKERITLPTRAEVNVLRDQINELSKKIDELP
jgi:polyhydroxyalkanoate synthesis regulator phasin